MVARSLQALGLVLLPVGLWHGMFRGGGMTTELALLVGGAVVFLAGTALLKSGGEG